jgi:hypothetical protein
MTIVFLISSARRIAGGRHRICFAALETLAVVFDCAWFGRRDHIWRSERELGSGNGFSGRERAFRLLLWVNSSIFSLFSRCRGVC